MTQGLLRGIFAHVLRHLLLVLFRPVYTKKTINLISTSLLLIMLRSIPVQIHGGRVTVERICRVGIGEKLWQEALKDV